MANSLFTAYYGFVGIIYRYRIIFFLSWQKEDGPRLKLECVGQWSLHGWIQSIAAVRLTGAERDTLLLTFKVRLSILKVKIYAAWRSQFYLAQIVFKLLWFLSCDGKTEKQLLLKLVATSVFES